jgi:hypothetical protein
MKKKISDNPSYQKLRTEMGQFSVLGDFLGHLDPNFQEKMSKLRRLQTELESAAKMPDDFNHIFSDRGWITYESMSSQVMETSINVARAQGVDEGEKVLLEYYSPENVKNRLGFIRGISQFLPRMRLIELALEDYTHGRMHSCIPLLLMMADGVVSDVTKQVGLFAESVDVTALDSIAGHESGLGSLLKLFGKTLKKTNVEPISIPHRHGILHGRELSYDNQVVAAKTWGLLFAVRDWIVVVSKPAKQNEETALDIKETLTALKKVNEVKKLLNEWRPRKIKPGVDIPASGDENDYEPNSPEQMVMRMFSLWKTKNYGTLARMAYLPSFSGLKTSSLAGELRESLSGKDLITYMLSKIDDQAPAITEITCRIVIRMEDREIEKELTIRCIYADDSLHTTLVRQQELGRWSFIDNFRHEIYFLRP